MNELQIKFEAIILNDRINKAHVSPFLVQKPSVTWARPLKCWQEKEIHKLMIFCLHRQKHSNLRQGLRHYHSFQTMSKFIKSRSTNQCRVYFMRLLRSFKSIEKVMSFFQQYIQQSDIYLHVSTEDKLILDNYTCSKENINYYKINSLQISRSEEDVKSFLPTGQNYQEEDVKQYKNNTQKYSMLQNLGRRQENDENPLYFNSEQLKFSPLISKNIMLANISQKINQKKILFSKINLY